MNLVTLRNLPYISLFMPFMLCGQVFTPGEGVSDVDGNTYPTVLYVNGQEWMAENLRTTRYANGDSLIHAPAVFDWQDALGGAWCHYANDTANELTYGKLYNAGTVRDERGVCPAGWHVPVQEEWSALIDLLDPDAAPLLFGVQSALAGGLMKESGTQLWTLPNTGATNSAGFSGVPSGTRDQNGNFLDMGTRARWWSGSPTAQYAQRYYELGHDHSELRSFGNFLIVGYAVRCVKDDVSTGYEPSSAPSALRVFPVPAVRGEGLTISGHVPGSSYQLVSADGRVVRNGSLTGGITVIATHDMEAGTYILHVDGALPTRFMVVH
jgi:uncharacterized protein (TIGR02145 family)